MSDQTAGLDPRHTHVAGDLHATPQQEAELKDLLASIDSKLDAAERHIDKVLIRLGLEP